MTFILASKSPRRKEILKKINLNFKIYSSELNEKNVINNYKYSSSYCKNLAIKKATLVSNNFPENYVIGADTIVIYKNIILNKPKNRKEAFNHLNLLNNSKHTVYTGVPIINKTKKIKKSFIDKTEVYFNKLTNKEINYYIDKYRPYDKAGSYAIQEYSNVFIKKINGCFYNVVGFPPSKFYKLLNKELNILTNYE